MNVMFEMVIDEEEWNLEVVAKQTKMKLNFAL